jgi:alpha-1,2-mannosyltransferase
MHTIAFQQVLFGLIPLAVLVFLLSLVLRPSTSWFAADFRTEYYVAASRLLHGGHLYAWTFSDINKGIAFPYPPLSALIFTPFTLLSVNTASIVFVLICVGLVPLTLWVLDVRDWRAYGVSMLWVSVFNAWQSANETLLLVFMIALIWRYRDRPAAAGLLTAAAISLKPFVWPLALWLLATRRWRASLYSLSFGVVVNLAVWSIVGFAQVRAYLHLSSLVTKVLWQNGYSVLAFAHQIGFGRTVGEVLLLAAACGLVAAVLRVGWLGYERLALLLVVLLIFVASPLVWDHYLALLLIPVALERRRLNWLWALPVVMWLCPVGGYATNLPGVWLLTGVIFVSVIRTARA